MSNKRSFSNIDDVDNGDASDIEDDAGALLNTAGQWLGDGQAVNGGMTFGMSPLGDMDLQQGTIISEADLERDRLKLLLSNFNDDQMARYEAFRRANINRSAVKKLANAVLNQSITGNVAVALSGMSKVFVGEIVEKARDVQARMDGVSNSDGQQGERPLRPEHLREAWRLFKQESGTVPAAQWRRQGGEGDGMMFR